MPTRLARPMLCVRSGSAVVCAQITPYRSPFQASDGTRVVNQARRTCPGARSISAGVTVVQLDSSFGVRSGAKTKAWPRMSAAAG